MYYYLDRVRNQKRCMGAQTWQLILLAIILILVTLFTLCIVISDKKVVKTPALPTWVFNDEYKPEDGYSKELNTTERLALELVNQMVVSGKVVPKKTSLTVSDVKKMTRLFKQEIVSCWHQLTMKDYKNGKIGELFGVLAVGRSISIKGQVNANPDSFTITLLTKNAIAALDLTAEKSTNDDDFVQLASFIFSSDLYFELTIRCDEDDFNVIVNDLLVQKYKYRISLDKIAFVRVTGSIKLIDVKQI